MVWTTTNLFKGIACPEGERCQLTSCIFSHELRPQATTAAPKTAEAVNEPKAPASKRRKITADDSIGKPLSKSDQIREQLAADRRGGSASHSRSLPSLVKPVTPPPTNGRKSTNNTSSDRASDNSRQQSATTMILDSKPKENLNPRLVPSDPVGHAKRTLYLKCLHTEMVRLNQRVADAKDRIANWKGLMLSEQELIGAALDEEEALAKAHAGTIYANKIKLRIASYRKMDVDAWITHVKANVIKTPVTGPKKVDPDEKVITTGLSSDEEILILPYLVADQTDLAQYGYVPIPPTAAEAAKAQEEVEFGKNYEKCDRCGANFQVFPERNADGLLTSHGPCKFHPKRKVPPSKTKNDFHGGAKLPYHPCCNEIEGSIGCTTHDNHVFKIDPVARARLAAILPFINTPENQSPSKDKHGKDVKAVSFDCEMGYTTCGLELIRLTAVNWPSGEDLVDVLVRPVGTIIDLNSQFSGVFPEHFANAIPYEAWESYVPPPAANDSSASPTTQILPVVPSITAARTLLTSFLTPHTPLIGHAIDNDLNVTRLCHPTIIDTILLFRHPRGPLPLRLGLKALTLQYLGKKIQQGGDRGHDSAEDARSTGELVRVKVKERWAQLQRAGCEISGGKLGRQDGDGVWRSLEEFESGDFGNVGGELAKKLMDGFGNGGGGKKRKKGPKASAFGMDGPVDEDGDSAEQENERTAPVANGIAAFLPKG